MLLMCRVPCCNADVNISVQSSGLFKTLTAAASCTLVLAGVVSVVIWKHILRIKLYFKERRRTPPRDEGLSDSHDTLL